MINGTLPAVKRIWLMAAIVLAVVIVVASTIAGMFSNGFSDNSLANGSSSASKNAAKSAKKATKPRWAELTAAQKEALAPLAPEWDQINAARKKKWLEIGNKVATMAPDEKQRVQERIREWVKLTPEQRRVARTNYAHAQQLDPNEKFAQWQRYQQLTEEQKKELAAAGAPVKKQVANRPAKSEKIARSVKSTPKLELQKSVQPAASQPAPATTPLAPAASPAIAPSPVAPIAAAEAAPA